MIKLPIEIGNALDTLQAAAVSKADLIRIANGRYYSAGEVVGKLADTVGEYCRTDENLENVISAIVDGYETLKFDDYATKFSELSKMVLKINFETEYAAFMDFEGHVGTVDIHVAKGKKNPEYQQRVKERVTLRMSDFFTPEYDKAMRELADFLPVKSDET